MTQKIAARARALGLLAACALAQSTSQPELMVIAHNFAEHLARFLSSLRFLQRLRDGSRVHLLLRPRSRKLRTEED